MKRRTAGRGSIRKITLRSGVTAYRGEITVAYKYTEEGKRVAVKRTAQRATRREVEDRLDALRKKYRVGVDLDAEKLRLRELFDAWLNLLEAGDDYSPKTLVTYRWAADRAVEALANPLVVKIAPFELQNAITALGRGLKRKSLELVFSVLQQALSRAVVWRIIADNPADEVRLPKKKAGDSRSGRALTVEEVARFRAALAGERLELAVLIALTYGLRRGEVVAIRADQIDLDAGTLTINAQHQRSTGKIDRRPTKGHDTRVFPLPDWLRLAIARQIARVATERGVMGKQWTQPDEGLLFVRETDGGRLVGDQIEAAVDRTAKRAELGHVRPHDLRRTLQSLLAMAGVDRNVRAEIAGHTDPNTTDRHYRRVYDGEAGDALAKVNALMGLDRPEPTGGDDAE